MGSIKAICAADLNNGIGYNGELLVRDSEDMQHFRRMTSDNAIVMGKKTFDSLGGVPLRRRYNIVLTRTPELYKSTDRLLFTSNIDVTSSLYQDILQKQDIWIIGGGEIYTLFFPCVTEFHISRFSQKFEKVDTYLPKVEGFFKKKYINRFSHFTVEEWIRKN